jgi:hypothetical protein
MVKLCPVCFKAYYRRQIHDDGRLLYVHYEGPLDGENILIACHLTPQGARDYVRIKFGRVVPEDDA